MYVDYGESDAVNLTKQTLSCINNSKNMQKKYD